MNPDWLELAKLLPAGRSERIPCCKADKSALITHSAKGYSYVCFRCQERVFKAHGKRSIAELIKQRKEFLAYREYVKDSLKLPSDFCSAIPPKHRVWLFKAGITEDEAAWHNIGWSESMQRIILPVYAEDGDLICVQGRAVLDGQEPKYLNPKGPRVSSAVFYAPALEPADHFVVVEDILSAIKISSVAHAFSILGTNMTFERAAYISTKTPHVYLWFDNDKAGRQARRKAEDRLGLFDIRCEHVFSDIDPKLYTRAEIKDAVVNGRSLLTDA